MLSRHFTKNNYSAAWTDNLGSVGSWIANWWGDADSPLYFFPFMMFWGGLAQFIAGIYGIQARDTLVSIINTMWGAAILSSPNFTPSPSMLTVISEVTGASWLSIGLIYPLVTVGSLPPKSIYSHFGELAAWFLPLALTTWVGAVAAFARDLVLCGVLFTLAIGSTIATCLWSPDADRHVGIKVAAYFWLLSAFLAWYHAMADMIEEAYGPGHFVTRCFPVFKTAIGKSVLGVASGVGEPGVMRNVPPVVAEKGTVGAGGAGIEKGRADGEEMRV
jgi:uncharacterized protein